MDTTQPLATWAQQMAAAVRQRAQAKEQRHRDGLLTQAQAEDAWVKGMDQVVQTLEVLVRALKHTGQFPQLTLISHARSPQGTTTYMRRGMLVSLEGLEPQGPTIEFEIDSAPPFRPDLLVPTIRVIAKPQTRSTPSVEQEHFCVGISLQGDIVWQLRNPTAGIPPKGSVEDMLRSFLASLLNTD